MRLINKSYPTVTITTATYFGERTIEKFLECIFSQDYPKEKIELLFGDGGSEDKTLDIIRKYIKKYPKNIKLIHNEKRLSEGRGMGKDMLTRKADGEIIIILDQDNILVQKDWISNMVRILIENPEIKGVQSKMFAPKTSSFVDRYLNGLGIEDPFATSYSLNAQVIFNPSKFEYDKRGYYIYHAHPNNFLYAGGDGFVIKKKDLMEAGGYTQDIDNFYRMTLKRYKIAVPKNIKLHHNTSNEFVKYLKKRGYFVQHFLLENVEGRDFNWVSKKNSFWQNLKFYRTVMFNLLIIPGLMQALSRMIKEKEKFWLIHPIMLFLITLIYIYSFFYTRIFRKVGISYK